MYGVTTKNKIIEILYSHEYRLLVDGNIFDSSKFFYPVYQRSVELLKEIHSYPKCGDSKSCRRYTLIPSAAIVSLVLNFTMKTKSPIQII